jgi:uncharacterized protein (DUF736 family)
MQALDILEQERQTFTRERPEGFRQHRPNTPCGAGWRNVRHYGEDYKSR